MSKRTSTEDLCSLIGIMIVVFGTVGTIIQNRVDAQQLETTKPVSLNQNWTEEQKLRYYFTSQGTAIVPYDIFLKLEAAGSTAFFRSNRSLAQYGLIPHAPDAKYDPDGLPIGITKATVPTGQFKGTYAGISCAACHDAQLHYNGTTIMIDGGAGNTLQYSNLLKGLAAALTETSQNPDRFDRLAVRLNRVDPVRKKALRKEIAAVAADVNYYETYAGATPFDAGPGRIDCLDFIHNRVFGTAMNIPQNYIAALAPTKPPFLWNAPQSAWVQWTGLNPNALVRNAVEALGVNIKLDLASKTPADGLYDSSLDLAGQISAEDELRTLAPPKWPEKIFGPIDRAKAAEGAKLFAMDCASCHSVYPYRWSEPRLQGKRFIENALIPMSVIGTDAMQGQARQFNPRPTDFTGVIAPYLKAPYPGARLASWDDVMPIIVRGVMKKALDLLHLTQAQMEIETSYATGKEVGPKVPSYKAAPLEGIWATAPFLHNGSVPTLYDLLLPAAQRPRTFRLGGDFDPVKVGISQDGNPNGFLFDTSLVGNSNRGHSFEDGPLRDGVVGPLLTDEQRYAIIEYLKSIPTQDAQVTPFGGPANAVDAWSDPTFYNVKHPGTFDAYASGYSVPAH